MHDLESETPSSENRPEDARTKCTAVFVGGVAAFFAILLARSSFLPQLYLIPVAVLGSVDSFMERFVSYSYESQGYGAVFRDAAVILVLLLMLVAPIFYIRWWMAQCDERTARPGAGCSALRVMVGVATAWLATVFALDIFGGGHFPGLPAFESVLFAAAIAGGAVLGWSRPERFRSSVRTTYLTTWFMTWFCPLPLTM